MKKIANIATNWVKNLWSYPENRKYIFNLVMIFGGLFLQTVLDGFVKIGLIICRSIFSTNIAVLNVVNSDFAYVVPATVIGIALFVCKICLMVYAKKKLWIC